MLEYISVTGGACLNGTVRVSGAKNAALPLLFATLLTGEPCTLSNVPDLEDISVTLRLLESLGAESRFSDNHVHISVPTITCTEAPYSLVKRLRASFWVLGPLLARAGEARVSLPGGDAIGTRPVDLHLKGLMRMGAQIRMHHGSVIARAPGGLQPAHIVLDYPSVGATHNLLMAAAGVQGTTTIDGAAREPEVIALAEFLISMGADIQGHGTSCIHITGCKTLQGARIGVLGDRIEAATYVLSAAVTKGRVRVVGINPSMLDATIDILRQAGAKIECLDDGVFVIGPERLNAISFETGPFPCLATDVQPLLMAAMTKAYGTSAIRETVFENRFGHIGEYRRLGADITLSGRVASVCGKEFLSAAPVEATDIRAAAGLVLMGLMADGETSIHDIFHLDRGYDGMVKKLQSLGANIRRVPIVETQELVFGC